ncbi:hypothetical protein [Shewanella dokdonensis]|uniref:Uncharacterized protein n=1 Tax=Shewanella dokdonensis TaxID=712036 RepID=A0ABX8DEF4_9GAMM|nr:hypothetical protein [Shewanella dokdonensis]MCL1072961.1 hypothetical protein [Shewanella dokdonensis]QVK23117.1 hypothetical protein KHX94_18845 [Shewanella dokdonensis]
MSEVNQAPKTQKQRLVAILSDGNWHTLFEIQSLSRSMFGALDSETALSARWRELPTEGREKRVRPGTNNTFEYRMVA